MLSLHELATPAGAWFRVRAGVKVLFDTDCEDEARGFMLGWYARDSGVPDGVLTMAKYETPEGPTNTLMDREDEGFIPTFRIWRHIAEGYNF